MRPIPWLFIILLTLAPAMAPAQHIVLVKADSSLTLRENASSTAKALGKLTRFQPVELLSQSGDWAKIKTTDIQTGSVLTGYVLASYLTANAFAFTGSEKVNGRYGPGTQYDVIIEYDLPNIPFNVRQISGDGWVMVMDYDGDRSWVSAKSLKVSGKYVITKEKTTNFRKGVGLGEDQVFIAPKGTILQVLEDKVLADNKKWLHVKHSDGDEGWVSANVVFGWNDVPAPGTAKTATGGADNTAKSAKSGKSGAADSGAAKKTTRGTTKKAAPADDDSDSGSGKSAAGASKKTSTKGSASKTGSTKSGTAKKAAPADDDSDSGSGKSAASTSKKTSTKSSASKTGTTKSTAKKAVAANETVKVEAADPETPRARARRAAAASDE